MKLSEIILEMQERAAELQGYEKLNVQQSRELDVFNHYLSKLKALNDEDWVSVEVDTPKIWGDYLVSTGSWVGSCHYDGKFYDYSVNKMKASSRFEIPVKHWKSLPTPPNIENSNQ